MSKNDLTSPRSIGNSEESHEDFGVNDIITKHCEASYSLRIYLDKCNENHKDGNGVRWDRHHDRDGV